MPKQYRAAIVGCGSIGQAHMQGYQRIDNIDVVAVTDPLEPARNMYMTEYGIERELRDATGSKLYSGTSEIQRTIIAPLLSL